MNPRLAFRVRRVAGAPVVAVRALLRGGARLEEIPGQAHVTGRMLTEGTRRRDWRRVAEEAEALGMSLSSAGTYESHGVALDALASDWERALEWVAELTREPAFFAERCAWIAQQAAAELESLADHPDVLTQWAFQEQLYHPHPRARPLQGGAEALAGLEPEHCAAFHRAAWSRGAVITVAGEIEEDAVLARLEALFGDLAGAAAPAAEPAAIRGRRPRRRVTLPPGEQAHLLLGHLTVPRSHRDTAALELVGVVLGAGAGLSGRVPQRVREREGLAYATHVQTLAGAGLDPGHLMVYVGTSTATAERAERGAREEIARLLDEGLEEAELEQARAYLLGREPFRRETARQWAELLAQAEVYGLPLEDLAWRQARLCEVDRAAVEAAARRHLRPRAIKVTLGVPGTATPAPSPPRG